MLTRFYPEFNMTVLFAKSVYVYNDMTKIRFGFKLIYLYQMTTAKCLASFLLVMKFCYLGFMDV